MMQTDTTASSQAASPSVPPPTAGHGSSYSQILKSSSIIGGAQGINYLIGMVRTKLVAILLGPSGVGLVGLYNSATGLVGVLAGLGVGSSGVREVAEAHGSGDAERVARTIRVLRRSCWATGLLGWALTAAFAWPLSIWTFGSTEHAWAVALLGSTLLFGAIAGGQMALIQGVRRIGDIARLNVLSVVFGTIVAVGFYGWLGQRGIVPVLIIVAVINLASSWWFARKVTVPHITISWAETWQQSRRLIGLGAAFMWSGLLTATVGLITRSLIARQLGLDANGIYQAAWGISGVFAGFILSAMGTDFYPRLTAVSHDNDQVNRLVNEQTEIGILLALPGILATLIFAPWFMRIFYTAKFLPGAELLPWFVLGVFGRVISWPIGFIQLAKGASRWFVATDTASAALWLGLTVSLLHWLGLWGVALAFAILYGAEIVGNLWVGRRLSGFHWSGNVWNLLAIASVLVASGFAVQHWLSGVLGLIVGAMLTVLSVITSLRGIAARLGSQHRIVRLAARVPGLRFACGL
ncbi:MAG: O-antigen translocase [Verrucomicrobiota bacterium]|jgi:PST family polysaccharide transporter